MEILHSGTELWFSMIHASFSSVHPVSEDQRYIHLSSPITVNWLGTFLIDWLTFHVFHLLLAVVFVRLINYRVLSQRNKSAGYEVTWIVLNKYHFIERCLLSLSVDLCFSFPLTSKWHSKIMNCHSLQTKLSSTDSSKRRSLYTDSMLDESDRKEWHLPAVYKANQREIKKTNDIFLVMQHSWGSCACNSNHKYNSRFQMLQYNWM